MLSTARPGASLTGCSRTSKTLIPAAMTRVGGQTRGCTDGRAGGASGGLKGLAANCVRGSCVSGCGSRLRAGQESSSAGLPNGAELGGKALCEESGGGVWISGAQVAKERKGCSLRKGYRDSVRGGEEQ